MPSTQFPVYDQGLLWKHNVSSFIGSGVDTYTQPPSQNPDFFEKMDNCFSGFPWMQLRWGYNNPSGATPGWAGRRMYMYQNDTTAARHLVVTGNHADDSGSVNAYNEDGSLWLANIFSTAGETAPPRMVNSRSYGFFVTGTSNQYKWDGTNGGGAVTAWGTDAPVTAITVGAPIGVGQTFALSSVSNASGGTTVYHGTITGGAANAYAGLTFTISGFLNAQNNGAFSCSASTATTITLANPVGVAETTAAQAQLPGTGQITLISGRKYVVVFRDPTRGNFSSFGPFSASTGPLDAENIPLSNIPVSADPTMTRKTVLATGDGGDETVLYFLADIPNATTTLTDNIDNTTLVSNNIYFQIDSTGLQLGVFQNDPPPVGMTVPIKHQGRLVGVFGQNLVVSKSEVEVTTSTGNVCGRYEEDWPADWSIDVSQQAETPRALLSDGSCIYIGSERMVRRIFGDNVTNFTLPETIFNEVGVNNQEVWQQVFMEGQPIGAIWLTPDFRVIQSDFNSYLDIGGKIQNQLATINPAAAANCCATYFGDKEYDLYVLAVPTGSNTDPDTLFVYNLRAATWSSWFLADPCTAMLYNIAATGLPQFWFTSNGTYKKLWQFGRSLSQDRTGVAGANIIPTVRTSWLGFNNNTMRHSLNSIEVLTGDTGLAVTIDQGSTVQDFNSPPTPVVSGAVVALDPFGEYWVPLAGKQSRERMYRFTFVGTGNSTQVLNGFAVEYLNLHQL